VEQVWNCLQALPEHQRLTVELWIDGYTHREIEERLAGSAKDRMFHGKRALEKCLQERYGWEKKRFVR